MKLSIHQNSRTAHVKAAGIINTDTAEEFRESLISLDVDEIYLDFSELTYITSAGLRVLLMLVKRLSKDRLHIENVVPEVEEVFRITGFDVFLNYSAKSNAPKFECAGFSTMLRRKAQAYPDTPMFTYKDIHWSWQDLNIASQVFAAKLSQSDIRRGSHVGICGFNTLNWLAAFFAIQKLGAIAILVNYGLGYNELTGICRIGDIELMCYGDIKAAADPEALRSALVKGGTTKSMYIGGQPDFTEEYPLYKDLYKEDYDKDDVSIMIFTSGSTGKPKGVLLSAVSAMQSAQNVQKEFSCTSQDRLLAFLPMFHVFGLCFSLLTLIVDAHTYFPDNSRPKYLLELIAREKITTFPSVPTMMLAIASDPDFQPDMAGSLRLSYLGGAAIAPAQMEFLAKKFPHTHFGIIYGMTENPVIALTRYEDTPEHICGTCGLPTEGLEIQIRDVNTRKPLPRGEKGEICVRSGFQSVCYYKLDVSDQPIDDEGWLLTGDMGYIAEDGYLSICGRIKDIIVRGGENISPGEVESALLLCAPIKAACVFGVEDAILGETVAAAVVLKEGAHFDADMVRKDLAARLAKYKIPQYFSILPAFPLLGNGKIDKVTIKKNFTK